MTVLAGSKLAGAALAGAVLSALALAAACAATGEQQASAPAAGDVDVDADMVARAQMVRTQIEARGVRAPRVLDAMRRVPRHRFVPSSARARAYDDAPLRIAAGQTISQPYIVAVMSEAAQLGPDSVVLEVGTGSGYQTAVLAELVGQVYSVEIVPELARAAAALLDELGYANVTAREGDGYAGWPAHAPFDAIVVTAAPPEVPVALLEQLKVGGRLVVPVGTGDQQLRVIERTPHGYDDRTLMSVRFVPMVRPR